MKVGHPPLFKSKEELQAKIDSYFNSCIDETGKQIRPYTITGLALALDTSRQTLINYEAKEQFFDTIKKAKNKIENYTEEQLYRTTQVTGVIFNLKNNYAWKDQQEIGGIDGKPLNFSFDNTFKDESTPSSEESSPE